MPTSGETMTKICNPSAKAQTEDEKIESACRAMMIYNIQQNRSSLQFFPVYYLKTILRLLDEARKHN
jgi:hypothetical protein